MIPLTDDENESDEKQKVCYTCKEEFNTDENDANEFNTDENVKMKSILMKMIKMNLILMKMIKKCI